MVAVYKRLNCCFNPASVSFSLEQLRVKITIPHRNISIGVMHLPPDRRSDLICVENNTSSIGAVLSRLHRNDLALLSGYYNQYGLVWNISANNHPSIDILSSSVPAPCYDFLGGFNLHGLTQINTVFNSNSRLLDLVLMNEAMVECDVLVCDAPIILHWKLLSIYQH